MVRDSTPKTDEELTKTRNIAAKYSGRHFMELYRRRAYLRDKYPDGIVYDSWVKDGGQRTVVRLTFMCPLRWEDMGVVAGDKGKRDCSACGHRVHLLTKKDVDQPESSRGSSHCVSVAPKLFFDGVGEVDVEDTYRLDREEVMGSTPYRH